MPTTTPDRKYPIPDPAGTDPFTPAADLGALGKAIDVDIVAVLARLKTAEDKLAASEVAPQKRMLTMNGQAAVSGAQAARLPWVRYTLEGDPGDPAANAPGMVLDSSGLLTLRTAGLYMATASMAVSSYSCISIRRGGQVLNRSTADGQYGYHHAITAVFQAAANDAIEVVGHNMTGGTQYYPSYSPSNVGESGPTYNSGVTGGRPLFQVVRLGA